MFFIRHAFIALGLLLVITLPGALPSAFASAPQTNLTVREITKLDKLEPYIDSQTFHAGLLWVGRSRINGNIGYQVEAYLPDGTSAAAPLRLSHTASYLYPFGASSILVVGKSSTPYWKTHYSIVQYSKKQLLARTFTFPEELQADRFAGDPAHLFFSEPGSAAIFSLDSAGAPRSARFLSPAIHAPSQMLYADGNLFIIEDNNIMSPNQGNLIKLNPNSQVSEHTFKKSIRKGLTNMVKLSGSRIALTERLANQILLVHTDTNTVEEKENIHTTGAPWGITNYGGKCIAVLAYQEHAIRIFDVSTAGSPLVADWNLMGSIDRFHRPRALAADPVSGRLYVRSDDYCPTCQISFNAEYLVEEPGSTAFGKCR